MNSCFNLYRLEYQRAKTLEVFITHATYLYALFLFVIWHSKHIDTLYPLFDCDNLKQKVQITFSQKKVQITLKFGKCPNKVTRPKWFVLLPPAIFVGAIYPLTRFFCFSTYKLSFSFIICQVIRDSRHHYIEKYILIFFIALTCFDIKNKHYKYKNVQNIMMKVHMFFEIEIQIVMDPGNNKDRSYCYAVN